MVLQRNEQPRLFVSFKIYYIPIGIFKAVCVIFENWSIYCCTSDIHLSINTTWSELVPKRFTAFLRSLPRYFRRRLSRFVSLYDTRRSQEACFVKIYLSLALVSSSLTSDSFNLQDNLRVVLLKNTTRTIATITNQE